MREHIKESLSSFFIITALINIAMFVLGTIYRPEQRFGYEVFIYPPLNAALSCIPHLVMFSKKELTIKQVIIRKTIQLVLIIAIMLAFIMGDSGFDAKVAAGISVSVVIIFIAVHIIQWYLDLRTAEKMTEDLKTYLAKSETSV
ncbi:MAG: hypothetical protein IKR73_00905 [Oscillospiraceae bacterium]|nr:hypothetical protein [Oscillospiraceae bacterium]